MAVIHISDSDFQKEVLEAEGLVLVDFWAPWCGPCRMLEPTIEELAEETGVKVCKVNVDEHTEYAQKYGIMSIPNIVFFKNGEIVDALIGLQDKDSFTDTIKKHS